MCSSVEFMNQLSQAGRPVSVNVQQYSNMEETIVNFQSCCRLCLCETTDAFKNAAEDRVLPRRILDSLAIK
ncbi:unnamed protein product, partial [Callosobruchus maculatus]